jgi:hypothetical protein
VCALDTTTVTSPGTLGGQSLQLVGDYLNIHCYRVINPTAGATTASATISPSDDWAIHIHPMQDVDQVDPDDTPVTNTNTEQTTLEATVTSATNDHVVACSMMISSDIAPSAGSTLSTEQESIMGAFRSSIAVYKAGASSVSLGASTTFSAGDNIIFAVNVRNAAGAVADPVLGRRIYVMP